MPSPRRRILFSIFQLIFWFIVFLQVPIHGEMYPFSFFGMYKGSKLGISYQAFTWRIFRDEKEICVGKNSQNYQIENLLREILLKEVKDKNRFVLKKGKSINKVSRLEVKAIEKQVVPVILSRCNIEPGSRIQVRITHRAWKKLTQASIVKADRELVVYKGEHVGN